MSMHGWPEDMGALTSHVCGKGTRSVGLVVSCGTQHPGHGCIGCGNHSQKVPEAWEGVEPKNLGQESLKQQWLMACMVSSWRDGALRHAELCQCWKVHCEIWDHCQSTDRADA